jgi:hypothetical protein
VTHDTNAVAHDANEREQWEMLLHMIQMREGSELELKGTKGNKGITVTHHTNTHFGT